MHKRVKNILIPNLPRVGVRKLERAVWERRGGLRGSGCACAGGREPSGASSSSRAAHRRSSSPSASAPCLRCTASPGHSLVSPAVGGRKHNPDGQVKVWLKPKADRFWPNAGSFVYGEPHRHA